MSSLLESYQPTFQTIIATERTNAVLGASSKKMKADDLTTFLLIEAQHCVINDDWTKGTKSALAAHRKKYEMRGWGYKSKLEKPEKSTSGSTCKNCHRLNHTKEICWFRAEAKKARDQSRISLEKGRKKSQPLVQKKRTKNSLHLPAHLIMFLWLRLSKSQNPNLVLALMGCQQTLLYLIMTDLQTTNLLKAMT